jgi:hypothetical protein
MGPPARPTAPSLRTRRRTTAQGPAAATPPGGGAGGRPAPPRPWPRSPPPAHRRRCWRPTPGRTGRPGVLAGSTTASRPGRAGSGSIAPMPARPPTGAPWRSAARAHPHGCRRHRRPLVRSPSVSLVTCKCRQPASRDRYGQRVAVLVRHVTGDLGHREDVDQVEEQLERRRPMVLSGGSNASQKAAASLRLALVTMASLLPTVRIEQRSSGPSGPC